MDASMTPFDAGVGAFVDLDRADDFFGKTALQTADRRTRIYGISHVGRHGRAAMLANRS